MIGAIFDNNGKTLAVVEYDDMINTESLLVLKKDEEIVVQIPISFGFVKITEQKE